MEQPVHYFSELFEQLGLRSDAESIEHFIQRHSPFPKKCRSQRLPAGTKVKLIFFVRP